VERHREYGNLKYTGSNRHGAESYADYYVGSDVVVRHRVSFSVHRVYEMENSPEFVKVYEGDKAGAEKYLAERFGIQTKD
jgi:hypothetical protein